MSKKTISLGVVCVLLGTVSIASAEVVHSTFWADMDIENNIITNSSEPIYEYPQPTGPTWSNLWFFNSPEIRGDKWIEYAFEINNTNGSQNDIEIAINWSNDQWLDTVNPPIDDIFVVRETIWLGPLDPGGNLLTNVGDPIWVGQSVAPDPSYNPIWVSFDIRAFPGGNPGPEGLQMDGEIWHEHVPEPATMSVLAIGGLALLRRRRRA